jgi:hypothetical protein
MRLGVPRLKRAVIVQVVILLASLALISCGKSNSTTSSSSTTKLTFRVFVSQDVSTAAVSGGLIIIDAKKDLQRSRITGGLGSSFLPGKMFLSNNRQTTLAVSDVGTSIEVVSNSSESVTGTVSLPGATESVVISVDGATAYAAVPTAFIPQGNPGGVVAMSLSSGAVTSTVPVPGVRYLAQSADGAKLLAFPNDNSNAVTIVSPFNIVVGPQNSTCPSNICTVVSGFDHPVAGFFSSDNTQAWILNCGPECGGTEASVQVLDLIQGKVGNKVAVDGATVGLIANQTLYVAGTSPTAPGNACTGVTTVAPTCGRLEVVDLPSMTVTGSAVITDGYHTNMDMGNGQLFIGSRLCSEVIPPAAPATGEQRGCLTIVNTNLSITDSKAVIFPPDNGDVTGMTPITNRTVFYVVEGGEVRIYDTTTDKIYSTTSIDVFGNAVDVKLVDF